MQGSFSVFTVATQYNSAYLRISFIFNRVKIHENTEKSSITGKNGGGASLAALVCFTGIESASALDFNFSFDNTILNVPGTVEGTIQGLNDNSTGAASAVLITSFPAGLGGSFDISNDAMLWDNILVNEFTVTNGSITAASFDARNNSGGDTLCLNASGASLCTNNFNLLTLNGGSSITGNNDSFSGVTFSSATPVPFETEPTLGILLAAAFFGSRHLHHKHKAKKLLLNNK